MRVRLQHVHVLMTKLDTPVRDVQMCSLEKMHRMLSGFFGKSYYQFQIQLLIFKSSARICFVHKPLVAVTFGH